MIITKRIEIRISEKDEKLKKEYYQKLFDQRYYAMSTANLTAVTEHMLTVPSPYFTQEQKENFVFIGCKGTNTTRKNAPYVAASMKFKGKADMAMLSSVVQTVQKAYREDVKSGMSHRSLRNYKDSIPMPFKPSGFRNMKMETFEGKNGKTHEELTFTLMNIPFKSFFGKDWGQTRQIVKNALDENNEDYTMCTSSIQLRNETDRETGKKHLKIYLLFCVDIPEKKASLNPKKVLYAYLGIENPIVYNTVKQYEHPFMDDDDVNWYVIGTKDNFLHRRRQIQEALKKCQKEARFNSGGHGRKHKLKVLERWHKREKNYINTALHNYSRELIKAAVRYRCGTIYLVKQKEKEDAAKDAAAKGEPAILRNWSYFGLKSMINYKAAMYGITVLPKKEDKEEESID